MFKKTNYIAVFLSSEQGNLKVIGKKKFDPASIEDTIKFKKKEFPIQKELTHHQDELNVFYFFNYDKRSQYVVSRGRIKEVLVVEIMDQICDREVVSQSLKASDRRIDWAILLPYMFGAGLLGLIIGYVMGVYL